MGSGSNLSRESFRVSWIDERRARADNRQTAALPLAENPAAHTFASLDS